jgi:hypothetical protein
VTSEIGTTDRSGTHAERSGQIFQPHVKATRSGSRSPRTSTADIICAGMYRACSTWQYEVVAHLIEQSGRGERLGYLMSGEYADLRRAERNAETSVQVADSRCRVFKSHDADQVFAQAMRDGSARVIYAYRDVRDVIFSLMHKRGLTFEELMRQGMIHQVLANDRFWMAQPGRLVQRYDDLVARPADGVLEIARFLEIPIDRAEAERIAEMYSQEANRARTQALRDRLQQSGIDLDNAANTQICDPKTLLHWNHLRPGGGGSWVTRAMPRHHAILRRMCSKWLRAHGYPVEMRQPAQVAQSQLTVRERIEIEMEILVGGMSFLVQSLSRRFPTIARRAKALLGIGQRDAARAKVWSDSDGGKTRGDTAH